MSNWSNCLYISIDAEKKCRNVLSGQYNFHSLYKNIPAYIREGGRVPKVKGEHFYFAYIPDNIDKWHIQNDGNFSFLKSETEFCGIFSLQTKGNEMLFLGVFLVCESLLINFLS